MGERVQGTARLAAPDRHEGVRRAPHYDAAARQVFDRLTGLVTALLHVPVALITVVDGDELLFVSYAGPEDPWATTPGIPLAHAACQHAILSREPLPIESARTDPLVRDSPAIAALGIGAYLGAPLVSESGEAFGTLCAIDTEPHEWTDEDVRTLADLGATVTAYVDARPATQQSSTGLNIAAVARRTGIGADTLRKWERRYGVLRPSRTKGGQRRYDDGDVARVEWLRDRLVEGFRIGEAAALLETDGETASSTVGDLRNAIVEAVSDPDTRRLAALVEQAFTLHDVAAAVTEIVGPALRTVGDRWRESDECIAEEHLLSDAVRSRLRRLLDDRRHGVRGTAVLACAPGERHELGLLALAVLLQADGWLAVFLGADSPLESVFAIAARIDANVLCLSASVPETADALGTQLGLLELPERLRVVVGGQALGAAELGRPVERLGDGLAEAVLALRA